MKTMFLKSDQESANRELDCYGFCLSVAIERFMNGDFEGAIRKHENIIRSLYALERMKQDKKAYDKAALIWEQIRADQYQKELLVKLRGQV